MTTNIELRTYAYLGYASRGVEPNPLGLRRLGTGDR